MSKDLTHLEAFAQFPLGSMLGSLGAKPSICVAPDGPPIFSIIGSKEQRVGENAMATGQFQLLTNKPHQNALI